MLSTDLWARAWTHSSSKVEGDEGFHLLNCQTNLAIVLHALSHLFWHFVKTTAYHLDWCKPSTLICYLSYGCSIYFISKADICHMVQNLRGQINANFVHVLSLPINYKILCSVPSSLGICLENNNSRESIIETLIANSQVESIPVKMEASRSVIQMN